MENLKYIVKKFNLDPKSQMPLIIKNYCRNDLAQLFCDLGFRIGAEIGVKKGYYSKILCLYNPELKLYSIDPWMETDEYRDYTQDKMERYYEESKRRLESVNCELIRKKSLDAVKDFDDNSLDFVYIDGDHRYKSVIDDLTEWSRKVKPNGIIAGHDWGLYPARNCDVEKAVPEFIKTHSINPWFVIDGHRNEKGVNLTRPNSFFWVKE